ncbi:ATP synthase delta chain [Thioalkalivibrio nitratireducens DSM 14787]|uniref:ATP synthase subunit delta n=1 Tax=Thioalkalivibrio nitratireducens (strain DSM 14787 / UNIQEM 213 / ALEN2) TaxID=1255043 RepID=L0E3T8_THIND|nr:F0F1 ATP synthase subunit delta [Thioalkalivibrio nitratireducens]AGA35341.1 ATP synthase delta chain [Thioalkalivibrio nitratireducens DSM 14787]
MSDMTPVARPYARAAFELAQSRDALQAWDDELALLAAIAEDERVHSVLADPRVERGVKAQLMLDIADGQLSPEVQNFLRLLAERGRLAALPSARAQFAALKAETEKKVVAQVVSYRKVTQAQEKQILDALRERLGCEVELDCSVDASLLGGVVVRAGDLVIDGSVRGQLNRLAVHLSR